MADTVEIPVNKSEIISIDGNMKEMIVADPTIADVVAHGSNKISVIGKRVGKTTISIFGEQNKVLRDIEISITYDLQLIRKTLGTFFPNESVGVEMVGSNIALTGTVNDADTANKIVNVVNQFITNISGGTPAASTSSSSGNDTTPTTNYPNIINMLQIKSGQQVMLRVRVGEIQRNALKKLGFSLGAQTTRGNATVGFEAGGQELFRGAGEQPFSRTLGETGLGMIWGAGSVSVQAALDALETDGLFKVLAEPNLVAISGEKAEFLAGGEFPIPINGSDDNITVEFKQYGVAVQFTPYVLSPERIRLVVQPEVSELTDVGSVNVNGLVIPAISARRAKTTIELAPGEGFMIAGLIKDKLDTNVNETPGVAEVPILSSLFRATSFERSETELVIAVTPYLVDPMVSKDIKLPTDNFKPASVMDSIFYGAIGSLDGDALERSQRPKLEGPVGFMVE